MKGVVSIAVASLLSVVALSGCVGDRPASDGRTGYTGHPMRDGTVLPGGASSRDGIRGPGYNEQNAWRTGHPAQYYYSGPYASGPYASGPYATGPYPSGAYASGPYAATTASPPGYPTYYRGAYVEPNPYLRRPLRAYDLNGDGVISAAEYQAFYDSVAFARMDRDGDGFVTQAELDLYETAPIR